MNPVTGSISASNHISDWTDGYFEFQIIVLYNAKDGSGDKISIDFPVRPQDLYDVVYTRKSGIGGFAGIYTLTSVTPKEFYPNIPIATWDLKNFSTAWTYFIYEKNTEININITTTVESEYATNFEISAGDTKKVGGKFGASASTTSKKEVTISYKEGSTNLGTKVSYFSDPIIIDRYSILGFKTYELAPGGSASYIYLSVEPWSVIESENY